MIWAKRHGCWSWSGFIQKINKNGTCCPRQDALTDGVPMVVFSGQVPTGAMGTDAFQDLQMGLSSLCAWLCALMYLALFGGFPFQLSASRNLPYGQVWKEWTTTKKLQFCSKKRMVSKYGTWYQSVAHVTWYQSVGEYSCHFLEEQVPSKPLYDFTAWDSHSCSLCSMGRLRFEGFLCRFVQLRTDQRSQFWKFNLPKVDSKCVAINRRLEKRSSLLWL